MSSIFSIIFIVLMALSFIVGIYLFCKMFNDAFKSIFKIIKARDYESAFLYSWALIAIVCIFIGCLSLIVMYFSNVDLKC